MKTRILIAIAASLIFCVGLLLPAFGQEMKPIKLPEPKLDQSKSLAQVLKDRKTQREYSSGNLIAAGSFKPALGRMGHKPGRFGSTHGSFRIESSGDGCLCHDF